MAEKIEKLDEKLRTLELDMHLAKDKLGETSSLSEKLSVVEKRLENYDRIKWFLAVIAIFFGVSGSVGWQQLDAAYDKIESLEEESKIIEGKFSALNDRVKKAIYSISTAEEKSIERIAAAASEARDKNFIDMEKRVSDLQLKYSPKSTISSKDLSAALKRVDDLESGLKNGDFFIKARGLSILNEIDESVISLVSRRDNSGQLTVSHSNGNYAVAISAFESGNSNVNLYSSDGKIKASLLTAKDGGSFLLKGKNGKISTAILSNDSDGGYLRLRDEKGRNSSLFSIQKDGDGYIKLHSNNGDEDKVFNP